MSEGRKWPIKPDDDRNEEGKRDISANINANQVPQHMTLLDTGCGRGGKNLDPGFHPMRLQGAPAQNHPRPHIQAKTSHSTYHDTANLLELVHGETMLNLLQQWRQYRP